MTATIFLSPDGICTTLVVAHPEVAAMIQLSGYAGAAHSMSPSRLVEFIIELWDFSKEGASESGPFAARVILESAAMLPPALPTGSHPEILGRDVGTSGLARTFGDALMSAASHAFPRKQGNSTHMCDVL